MDKKGFLQFLKETKRTRPNPNSQIGHVQLLEGFCKRKMVANLWKKRSPRI
jgi:hypothetical protein